MTAVFFTNTHVSTLKNALRKRFPAIKSSHLSEALAAALDFKTHIGLVQELRPYSELGLLHQFSLSSPNFLKRLRELGVPAAHADTDDIITDVFETLGLPIFSRYAVDDGDPSVLRDIDNNVVPDPRKYVLLRDIPSTDEAKRIMSSDELRTSFANWLTWDALEYRHFASRQLLAKIALAFNPNQIDAYSAIASTLIDPADRIEHLEKAVNIGRKNLAPLMRAQGKHATWWDADNRSFRDALYVYCRTLHHVGRFEDSVNFAKYAMELSTVGALDFRRFVILGSVDLGDWAAVEQHLEKSSDLAYARYTRVLLRLHAGADFSAELAEALDGNPYIPGLLSSPVEFRDYQSIAPHSRSEAEEYAGEARKGWLSVPGAIEKLLEASAALGVTARVKAQDDKFAAMERRIPTQPISLETRH